MIIAGTGHRPNKLGGYSDEIFDDAYYTALHGLHILTPSRGTDIIRNNAEIDQVIVGGAQGWDMALALACLVVKIPFILAVPFLGQEKMWPKTGAFSQESYNSMKEDACRVEIVSTGGFTARKMQIRNEWMVDHADIILALWDGSSGGTNNCIQYAKIKNKKIINLWECFNVKEK